MDKVIKFPADEKRNLARWEKLIRSAFRESGASKKAEDIITPDLLELMKKYDSMVVREYQSTLPETLNEDEIEACREIFQKFAQESFGNFRKIMNEVVGDLVEIRMRLYLEKGE